jgi:hypothetical protein
MATTNILADRSRSPLNRTAANAASASFNAAGEGGRTVETFEILHFAGWTQASPGDNSSPMGEAELT